VTQILQLSNVLELASRSGSIASPATSGSRIKLGFTTSTDTTSAITSALADAAGRERASEDAGEMQVLFCI
jgi:hypothetical protein